MVAALALLVLALLAPSAEFAVFSGLPLDSAPELFALAVLAPWLVSRRLRRLAGQWWKRCSPCCQWTLVGSLVGVVLLKALMFAAGVHWGFPACYRAPVVGTPNANEPSKVSWETPPAACEAAYANPFHRLGVTRIDRVLDFGELDWKPIDRVLDFGESDWNLAFVNARRFNIYPWIGGNVWRTRLPFEVEWRGEIEVARETLVRVSYVGEATVRLGDRELGLAPQYRGLNAVTLPVSAGRHTLLVRYRFDDGSRVGLRSPGPYAVFRLSAGGADGRGGGTPLRAVPPPPGWRILAGLGDMLLGAWILGVGGLLARVLWPLRRLLVAIVPLVVSLYVWETRVSPLPGALGLVAVGTVLLVGVGAGSRLRRTLGAWVALLAASLARAAAHAPSLGAVVYWQGGSDSLAYDGFAFAILESWSLEGGQAVFRHTPLYRYLRFIEHLVLGEGHPLIAGVGMATLALAVIWATIRFYPRNQRGWWRRAVVGGVGLLVLCLASADPVVAQLEYGLSEYPTWVLLPVLFTLLFDGRSRSALVVGSVLLAVSALTRANQAPALALVLTVALARRVRRHPRTVLLAGTLCVALALLPAAHNAYYGRRLVWLMGQAGGPVPVTVYKPRLVEFPPSQLLRVAVDPAARDMLWERLRGLTYRGDRGLGGGRWARRAFHGLEWVWVIALVAVALRRWRLRWTEAVLLATPLLYLGVHLFYQLKVHYPRHIVVGHLAMGLVTMLAASRAARPQAPGSGMG